MLYSRNMRPITIILSAFLLVPISVAASTPQFRDVSPSAWYATYVTQGVNLGIVSGYKDANGQSLGEFRPTNFVTLAEALKMAIEAQSYSGIYQKKSCPEECPLAKDLHHWAAPYVQIARERKFQIFDQDVSLDRPASRRQVAQIVADAASIKTDGALPQSPPFRDVPATSKYAIAIDNLKSFGIITGDLDAQGNPTGFFRPVDTINRAEALKMVISTGERFSELPKINADDTVTFEDDTDGPGGIYQFKFNHPKDVTCDEYHPEQGSLPYLQLNCHSKTDEENILTTIREYTDGKRPSENVNQTQPGFKTFQNTDLYVEIFTVDGQKNETWQIITSTFSFLR
jgi:hypothetical protein